MEEGDKPEERGKARTLSQSGDKNRRRVQKGQVVTPTHHGPTTDLHTVRDDVTAGPTGEQNQVIMSYFSFVPLTWISACGKKVISKKWSLDPIF